MSAEPAAESILIISDDSEPDESKDSDASAPTVDSMGRTRLSKTQQSVTQRSNMSRKSTAKSSGPSASDLAQVRNQQAMKRLRRLMEDNKFMKDFNPETSKREKNKLKKIPMETTSATSRSHDTRAAQLIENGQDLCDCLRLTCCGCFFSCPKCGSPKCGPKCRIMRKWMFESVVFDGADESLRNPLLYKPM
ncbi:ARL14 effector protein-like [Phlebotomus argentipes]|uniref:ARL14 effector protein-like n=1 Tax=Phlebotomus argentipes TaxID=94469 RepID=UPI002892A662|nr:ARL14 effector protein-like [Phlebotomus argentipes]